MSFASFHSIQRTDGSKARANGASVGVDGWWWPVDVVWAVEGNWDRPCCSAVAAAIASHRSAPVTWRLCPAASLKLFSIFVGVPQQCCRMEVKMTISSDTQKCSRKTGPGASNQTKKDTLRKRVSARCHQEVWGWKDTAFQCVIVLLCGNLAAEGIRTTVKLILAVIILSLTALTFHWELENGRLARNIYYTLTRMADFDSRTFLCPLPFNNVNHTVKHLAVTTLITKKLTV